MFSRVVLVFSTLNFFIKEINLYFIVRLREKGLEEKTLLAGSKLNLSFSRKHNSTYISQLSLFFDKFCHRLSARPVEGLARTT